MKVILLTSLAGPAGAWSAGDEYECSADEAQRFIAAGYAKECLPRQVTAKKKTEKAVETKAGTEVR